MLAPVPAVGKNPNATLLTAAFPTANAVLLVPPEDVIVPVALTMPPVKTLPPVMLAVKLTLVPVAAPILGVVKLALTLTMILPEPSNAVVLLSTLAENTVPAKLKPADPLAE